MFGQLSSPANRYVHIVLYYFILELNNFFLQFDMASKGEEHEGKPLNREEKQIMASYRRFEKIETKSRLEATKGLVETSEIEITSIDSVAYVEWKSHMDWAMSIKKTTEDSSLHQ